MKGIFKTAGIVFAAVLTLSSGISALAKDKEVVVTYNLNYEGGDVYLEESVKSGSRAEKPEEPERDGYYFGGWTTDPEGRESFSFTAARVREDTELYAKWLRQYTFEAEYVDVTGKKGQGSSDNVSGTQLILSADTVKDNGSEMGISNDYFMGKLYYNGAYIDFEINSETDASDVILILRLTPDMYDMEFTEDTWQILVNDEKIPYGTLSLTGAVSASDGGENTKRPFQNYEIPVKINLKAGQNTIRLLTNNNENHGGTFNADTPLIDCIYLCTDAELSWYECFPENVGQTMDDVEY